MLKKIFFHYLALMAMIACVKGSAFASEEPQPCWRDLFCPEGHRFEGAFYGGYLNIASQELVLVGGTSKKADVISKLDWTANNVWVIGAKWSFYIPTIATRVSLDGWSKVYAGGARLEDRDYLDEYNPRRRTHLSIHEKAKLQTALGLDLEYGTDLIYALSEPHLWKLGLLYGLKYTRFDWKAYGGDFFYDGYAPFSFPSSLKVIAYRQEVLLPYLGLQLIWKYNQQLSFKGFGKYSPFTLIQTKDDHFLRSRKFIDTFRDGIYWVLGGEAAWDYSPDIKGYIRYSYDRLDRTGGCTSVYKYGRYVGTYKVAGVEFAYQMVTVGISAFF